MLKLIEYNDFINKIVDDSNSSIKTLDSRINKFEYFNNVETLKNRGLFTIVDGSVIRPDKLTFDLKANYFNQMITKSINIEIRVLKEFDEDDTTISDSLSDEYDENNDHQNK